MAKNNEATRIDQEKIRLEASVIPKLKTIFRNMATDAQALYATTGGVPAQELSENYYPEFLKEVRDAMRKSIRFFGFDMRDTLEKKHAIFFNVEKKRSNFDAINELLLLLQYGVELKQIKQLSKIDDPDLDAKLNAINNDFMREVTVFVANQSEDQARFITDTNAREIFKAVQEETEKFRLDIQEQAARISELEAQPLTPSVQRQIERARSQLAASQFGEREIVGKNLRANLIDKSVARSDLIASQNIGLAEAWSRQTEGKLINDAQLATTTGKIATVVKTWRAILDTKTRPSHAQADSQQVKIYEDYTVENESLSYPRDPAGSAKNIINCRCVSEQEVELV